MSKRLPKIQSDKKAEELLEKDLSEYLSPDNFVPTTFEFAPKNRSISLRLSDDLLDAVKAAAKRRGIGYQRFIREALERYIKKDAA